MKKYLALCASVLVTAAYVFVFVAASLDLRPHSPDASYQTIDDALAIHRSLGWSVVSAPNDGRRYRICGAVQHAHRLRITSQSGEFKTGDRTVKYKVEVPSGSLVAVEGLDPLDGGPLTYAVLTRDLPEK